MLELENVRAGYGKSTILAGVSLSLGKGQRLAVLGRNGVGKTTLLKTIIGLLPISGGFIRLDGRKISSLSPHERCRLGMAYVPQGREILPRFTVRENLELGCLGIRDRKLVAGRMERVLLYFPALKEQLNRPGGLLSGGQQQQLAIGRALMMSPRILLLDEPTEGIQPNMIDEIGSVLLEICKETHLSMLLVEQNLNFARRIAENCLILQKGAAVFFGGIDSLDSKTAKRFLSV